MSINIESLSKKYIINEHGHSPYQTLRETLMNRGKQLFQFPWKKKESPSESFWALKDITFDVKAGDRVAVIGRNGAGKSTLLKILSRITPPTKGKVRIHGRTASLLEVGTGFHPELTGRENIFLNGVLLGMSKSEVSKKFDEIVDFADIAEFLDTPVKRYSSGMHVRLGFAVAAHLEPDILFLDEVLAVGDSKFQQKCIGKIQEVTKEGRTILFVTHNMSTINFCNKGLLLDKGHLIPITDIKECIDYYSQNMLVDTGREWKGAVGDDHVVISGFKLVSDEGPTAIRKNSSGRMIIHIEVLKPVQDLVIGFSIFNKNNSEMLHYKASHEDQVLITADKGQYEIDTTIDFSIFSEGFYRVDLYAGIHNLKRISTGDATITFEVVNDQKMFGEPRDGICPQWKTNFVKVG
jgi:lipopolysaccharide transport system ATP-binding protein